MNGQVTIRKLFQEGISPGKRGSQVYLLDFLSLTQSRERSAALGCVTTLLQKGTTDPGANSLSSSHALQPTWCTAVHQVSCLHSFTFLLRGKSGFVILRFLFLKCEVTSPHPKGTMGQNKIPKSRTQLFSRADHTEMLALA